MGVFVTFEGTEGCGKSTQISLLAGYLSSAGVPFVTTREPGGTRIGRKIREILLKTENSDITTRTELLLYAADRAQHVEEVIRPALDEGKVVLCDRFSDATVAYQGYGRGLDLELICSLNAIATQGLNPDLTFLIDCPVETGLARALRRSAGESPSEMRFEKEGLSFHRNVRKGYRKILEAEPERVVAVDGGRSREEVHREVLDIFLDKVGSRCSLKAPSGKGQIGLP